MVSMLVNVCPFITIARKIVLSLSLFPSVTSTISFALFIIFCGGGGSDDVGSKTGTINTYIRSSYGQNIKLAYKQF